MQKHQVQSAEQALVYITDCTLATVCHMAMLRSRKKNEFERQISIAQTAIDWMIEMKIDFSTTRAKEVVSAGSVKAWADKFIAVSNKLDVNQIAADRLDLLQGRENNGRGISCVRQLIEELRRGNKSTAAAIASNEWDKISSYQKIADEIKALGLVSANSYVCKR